MPNRILKESICSSEDIDKLTYFEESVFYRIIVNCDDYGRFDARPNYLKNMLFRTRENVTRRSIEEALKKLALIGLVKLYVAEGKQLLYLPKWESHQQIRSKKSKFPAPDSNGYQMISDDINGYQMISDDSICPRNPIQSESNPNPNPNPTRARDGGDIFANHCFSESIKNAVEDWLKYKAEKKQKYKDTGLRSLLTQISNKLKEFSDEQVIYAIAESMACNYQGIVWDKALGAWEKNKGNASGLSPPRRNESAISKYVREELSKIHDEE